MIQHIMRRVNTRSLLNTPFTNSEDMAGVIVRK
jgi:hypothetical protein